MAATGYQHRPVFNEKLFIRDNFPSILSIYMLSTVHSVFYVYPETVGGKESNAVCLMLHHFIYNFLDPRVKNLEIFCDFFFRYIYHVVHFQCKLDSIKISFPIRGVSYMECDKNFALIKQTTLQQNCLIHKLKCFARLGSNQAYSMYCKSHKAISEVGLNI